MLEFLVSVWLIVQLVPVILFAIAVFGVLALFAWAMIDGKINRKRKS